MVRKHVPVAGHKLFLFKPLGRQGFWTYGTIVKDFHSLVFLSGAVPLDEKGNLVGRGDMKKQIQQTVHNIKTVLHAAGLALKNVFNMRIYTTNIDGILRLAEWRCLKFPDLFGRKPGDQKGASSTLIEVRRLANPSFMVEIEVFAAT